MAFCNLCVMRPSSSFGSLHHQYIQSMVPAAFSLVLSFLLGIYLRENLSRPSCGGSVSAEAFWSTVAACVQHTQADSTDWVSLTQLFANIYTFVSVGSVSPVYFCLVFFFKYLPNLCCDFYQLARNTCQMCFHWSPLEYSSYLPPSICFILRQYQRGDTLHALSHMLLKWGIQFMLKGGFEPLGEC